LKFKRDEKMSYSFTMTSRKNVMRPYDSLHVLMTERSHIDVFLLVLIRRLRPPPLAPSPPSFCSLVLQLQNIFAEIEKTAEKCLCEASKYGDVSDTLFDQVNRVADIEEFVV